MIELWAGGRSSTPKCDLKAFRPRQTRAVTNREALVDSDERLAFLCTLHRSSPALTSR
jgi:hypothetical protein